MQSAASTVIRRTGVTTLRLSSVTQTVPSAVNHAENSIQMSQVVCTVIISKRVTTFNRICVIRGTAIAV